MITLQSLKKGADRCCPGIVGTIGAIYSETKSLKWTLGVAAYYLGATFLFGFLAYRIGLLLFSSSLI